MSAWIWLVIGGVVFIGVMVGLALLIWFLTRPSPPSDPPPLFPYDPINNGFNVRNGNGFRPTEPVIVTLPPLTQLSYSGPATFISQVRNQLTRLEAATQFPSELLEPLNQYKNELIRIQEEISESGTPTQQAELQSVRPIYIATGIILENVRQQVITRARLQEILDATPADSPTAENIRFNLEERDLAIKRVLRDYIIDDILDLPVSPLPPPLPPLDTLPPDPTRPLTRDDRPRVVPGQPAQLGII